MNVEFVEFKNRAARSEYISRRFQPLLQGKILDVGCDMAVLKTLLPGADYTGVDIGGAPDIQVNLEQAGRLPFPDGTFDCVVCTDVLEHLENLHAMFGELCRVTRRHIVLSLPNNWVNARVPIERGRGSFGKYGLPADKPADRHKWFFSLTEAAEFIQAQTAKYPMVCREMFATEKPRPFLVRAARRLRYPVIEHYLNRYAHTVWALLEKK
ncbi:MAG: class I SAM-dependent methyltransferase [Verrucomicrobiae bacterium]|nr:class I SAM-dependent methyltransferase [Verrucomicrobiae bacterium]